MARRSVRRAATRADAARTRNRTPAQIGPWRLDRMAARGRYTEIYAARPASSPTSSPAAYALKTLVESQQQNPTAVEMLRREVVVGVQVSHPHLISVLSARVMQPPYYLVTPWLEGAPLRAILDRGPPPRLPFVLAIVRQVAEALAALSDAGWIHGDVKPENIILSPAGHATLIDLGFARRVGESDWPSEEVVCGTLDYVAPEAVTSAYPPDARGDLYSLGVTAYEMLSGQRPFVGESAAELARRRAEDAPADIHTLEPELPLDLVHLVRSMLAKHPIRRPASPADVVDRLVRLEIETFAEREPLTGFGDSEEGTTNGHK